MGQFDYGRVPGWKTGGSGRIFRGWRPLFNAIAAPSTDALKRSSWYRTRVTRSAQSAALRSNRGWSPTTFPHTNLLNVHRRKVGRTSRPKSPSGPTDSLSRCWSSGAGERQARVSIRRPAIRHRKGAVGVMWRDALWVSLIVAAPTPRNPPGSGPYYWDEKIPSRRIPAKTDH